MTTSERHKHMLNLAAAENAMLRDALRECFGALSRLRVKDLKVHPRRAVYWRENGFACKALLRAASALTPPIYPSQFNQKPKET